MSMFNRDTQAKLNVIFYFFVCLFGFAFFYLYFEIIGKKMQNGDEKYQLSKICRTNLVTWQWCDTHI